MLKNDAPFYVSGQQHQTYCSGKSLDIDQQPAENVTPYFIHIDMAPDDRGMGIRGEWIIVT